MEHGVGEVGFREDRALELGAGQVGAGQLRPLEPRAAQVHPAQVELVEIGAREVLACERGALADRRLDALAQQSARFV